MNKEELIQKLKLLHYVGDPEATHSEADDLLLEYINDPDVTKAFEDVPRWYA